ncbi:hypothetical protein GGR56DRAFT_606195 [Xylariaceae sp. FL0804]|nr:hypothetical protein GGR56DRAFT_606195 [Xylariaceae sp. FL0804]
MVRAMQLVAPRETSSIPRPQPPDHDPAVPRKRVRHTESCRPKPGRWLSEGAPRMQQLTNGFASARARRSGGMQRRLREESVTSSHGLASNWPARSTPKIDMAVITAPKAGHRVPAHSTPSIPTYTDLNDVHEYGPRRSKPWDPNEKQIALQTPDRPKSDRRTPSSRGGGGEDHVSRPAQRTMQASVRHEACMSMRRWPRPRKGRPRSVPVRDRASPLWLCVHGEHG